MIYRERHWVYLSGNIFFVLLLFGTLSLSVFSTNVLLNHKDLYNLGFPYGLLIYCLFWWLASFALIGFYLYGRTKKPMMVVAVEIEGNAIKLTHRNASKTILTNVSKLIHSSYRYSEGLHLYDSNMKNTKFL